MSLLKAVHQLFKRGQTDPLTALLIKQIDTAIEAVETAAKALNPGAEVADLKHPLKLLRAEVRDVGDEVVEQMSASLSVPLEREDLFRVVQAITVVASDARDIVREMVMWGVKPGEWSKGSLEPAPEALQELREGLLKDTYPTIIKHFRHAYRLAARLRGGYEEGLTILFDEELTMDTLKRREILRRADLMGRDLVDLCEVFEDALAKRYM